MIVPLQKSVGTAAAELVVVPAGPGSVTLSVAAASTVIVYVGTSSSVSSTNGFPIVGGQLPVTVPLLASSSPTTLWAIASAAATPVGVLLSNAA